MSVEQCKGLPVLRRKQEVVATQTALGGVEDLGGRLTHREQGGNVTGQFRQRIGCEIKLDEPGEGRLVRRIEGDRFGQYGADGWLGFDGFQAIGNSEQAVRPQPWPPHKLLQLGRPQRGLPQCVVADRLQPQRNGKQPGRQWRLLGEQGLGICDCAGKVARYQAGFGYDQTTGAGALLVEGARETSMTSTIETQNARVVDRAVPALRPSSPKIVLNLALGFIGGIGLGLAFAFFVALIDDRVKSSFDIESVIGLQLVGVIPQIKKMELADKAQIVINNADRQVAEAFLTLHSGLRLKDDSKNAKCVLITSTIPGEGKSFTTTNLALTFAAHGEKVILVDCDLRKPSIHKGLRLENNRGVIDVCSGTATLDEAVIRNVHPNFDVLPAGGRAKNPTHILNSKNFEQMLAELRKRYDRVFVDTPPLAAVSDALIILPLVDGSIFTIFFNKVRRKAAQFAAGRLLNSNVPNFGAVLNGLNLAVSGYYYAQYYDKSYKDYYVVKSAEDKE